MGDNQLLSETVVERQGGSNEVLERPLAQFRQSAAKEHTCGMEPIDIR